MGKASALRATIQEIRAQPLNRFDDIEAQIDAVVDFLEGSPRKPKSSPARDTDEAPDEEAAEAATESEGLSESWDRSED